ncbi:hypothetical protein Goari_027017 [Gossypium aridum]|uniref:Uncharacterized protein n=1 Tax=Gossypium aridum TaxID=34290 RepID=A0A7J8YQ55_GOSAI|nr:hypothetical protein [Gossypium aridum]
MAIHEEEAPEMKNLATFLKWFYPLEHWADMLMFEFLKNIRVQWIVIIFYKPQYFMQHGSATQLAALPSSWIHKTYFEEEHHKHHEKFRKITNTLRKAVKESLGRILDQHTKSKRMVSRVSNTPPDDLERRIEQLELKYYKAREEKKRKVEELNITSDIDTDYDTEETESLS